MSELLGILRYSTLLFYNCRQNCFKESAKLFRQVYKRPEFLPSTVELANTNWVFISSNYAPKESKYIRVSTKFSLIFQLKSFVGELMTKCHAEISLNEP